MQAKYEETSLSKNSLEDIKHQCMSEIPVNAYVHVHRLCDRESILLLCVEASLALPNSVYSVTICN